MGEYHLNWNLNKILKVAKRYLPEIAAMRVYVTEDEVVGVDLVISIDFYATHTFYINRSHKYSDDFYTFEIIYGLLEGKDFNEVERITWHDTLEYLSKLKREQCPHCGSTNITKNGKQLYLDGYHQRFLCLNCHRNFSSEWVFE